MSHLTGNNPLRADRGPEAGVRAIPSPFIKIYERGRDSPYPPQPLALYYRVTTHLPDYQVATIKLLKETCHRLKVYCVARVIHNNDGGRRSPQSPGARLNRLFFSTPGIEMVHPGLSVA